MNAGRSSGALAVAIAASVCCLVPDVDPEHRVQKPTDSWLPQYGAFSASSNFPLQVFGADEALDSQAFDQIDGGITLHSVAASCCTAWQVNAVRGGGIDRIQR